MRVVKAEKDPSGLGCWSNITLIGKWMKCITIIMGYHCNQNEARDNTVWLQEKNFMQSKLKIIEFIQEKQQKGHDIILTINGNDLVSSPAINRIQHKCRLYDLLQKNDVDLDQQLQDTFIHGKN